MQEIPSFCDHGVVYKGGISINDGKVKPKTQTISSWSQVSSSAFASVSESAGKILYLGSCIGLLHKGTHIYTWIMVNKIQKPEVV